MTRVFIAPHRIAFSTAKRISDQIPNSKVIKCRNSRFNWNRRGGVVINWGRSDIPSTNRRILNHPSCIRNAANKSRFLSICQQNDLPAPRLLNEDECIELLENGKIILVRDPTSFGGRGIQPVRNIDEFTGIPRGHIGVQFFPKETEFRAHVWLGEVIFVTQKRRRRGVDRTANQKIVWNLANDYVQCREGVVCPEGLEQLALKAIEICDLDFGSVDIMLNKDGELRVLEVNTASGVVGKVADKYVEVIREI